MKKKIELLSPAGSFDCVKAAVQNGADAIYLGFSSFSARASAQNFTLEELKKYNGKNGNPAYNKL